ncbi:MAG TPA: glycine cleavage T C-terminal barrel domain-containing protein [Solirubrobacteraceae bacterium]|jgi:folate-binding protein YgfZ
MASLGVSDPGYTAITEGCGLVDRSERGKLALTGEQAKSFLQGQVSNDVEALTPGTGCYATFLTPKGKMLGDLRILDTGDELLLDTERMALQELFNMIRRFSIGYAAQLHKRTLETGMISLLGPATGAVCELEPGDLEHSHVAGEIDGLAVRAVRTDLGLDLFCAAADTGALMTALQSAGATPVSQSAAEVVRIERGRPRYGVDLDDTVIPQEADLNGRAVSFTKGCYVGQETVARLFYRGKPNRTLRGLRLSLPARTGDEIAFGARTVGRLGSVAESPALGPIGLALVRREAPPGSQVTVGPDEIKAVVVELPFER